MDSMALEIIFMIEDYILMLPAIIYISRLFFNKHQDPGGTGLKIIDV